MTSIRCLIFASFLALQPAPAYVLRQYTPQNRRLVWDDLRAALERARA